MCIAALAPLGSAHDREVRWVLLAKVSQQATGDGSVALYAIAIDSGGHLNSSIGGSNVQLHSTDRDFTSAMAWGDTDSSGAFDGGSGFTSGGRLGDAGGASTGGSGGGGGGCGNTD